jgi:cytochrome c-type biogenesis protein CcmH/NrfG
LYGSQVEVWFYLGCAYSRLGDWEPAVQAFHEAKQGVLTDSPLHVDSIFYYSVASMYLGKFDDATVALNTAAELAPQNAQIAYAQGVLAASKRDLEASRRAFANALALDPKFASAHFGLAVLDEQEGNYEQAVRGFNIGLGIEPNWLPARVRLGVAQAKAQDWNSAVATLKSVQSTLAQHPTSEIDGDELLFYLGLTHAQLGAYQDALLVWGPLHARQNDDSVLTSNLANIHYHLGVERFNQQDYVGATEQFSNSFRLCPIGEFRDALTEAYVRLGARMFFASDATAEKRAKGVECLRHAVELESDDLRPQFYLALASLVQGDVANAVGQFQALVDAQPENHVYRYHLALALLAQENSAAAIPLFQKLPAIDDDYTIGLQVSQANTSVQQGDWSHAVDGYLHSLQLVRACH